MHLQYLERKPGLLYYVSQNIHDSYLIIQAQLKVQVFHNFKNCDHTQSFHSLRLKLASK